MCIHDDDGDNAERIGIDIWSYSISNDSLMHTIQLEFVVFVVDSMRFGICTICGYSSAPKDTPHTSEGIGSVVDQLDFFTERSCHLVTKLFFYESLVSRIYGSSMFDSVEK